MNSQFRNSNFGFILYASIIGLIVAATIFVIWYMTAGYKLGTYETDTRLGSVYIGGLSEDEVIPRLDDKIDYWYNDDTIVFELRYQGYTYEFERNLLVFNIETSMDYIDQGKTNTMLVGYQPTDRDMIIGVITDLLFLENIIGDVDVDALIDDMLYDASLMKSYSCKDVEDYLVSEDAENLTPWIVELDSAVFSIPEGVQMDILIENVNKVFENNTIVVNSKELFDIVELLGTKMTDAEMTVIASTMLDLILDTNFLISEVHYEPTIDFSRYTIEDFPYYARNTVINDNENIRESFSFYNPNESAYYFEIVKTGEFTGEIKLKGLPFEYEIISSWDPIELNYITKSIMDPNYIHLLQNGYNGVIIEVQRTITDVYGVVIYNDIVLFEFYPPIKEIIFQP